ncbi:MAG: hypothetical protein JEZ11_10335 [Desulfobacterales bacterium]|nr:hypothetical protein [Desulfobacterales bacterium]
MAICQTINRRLSPMEKCLWIVDQQCCSNFLSHARVIGPLDETVLGQALKVVQARHPLLRVRIVREGRSHARFISGPAPAIPVRLAQSASNRWTEEAERELNTRFDAEKAPLLRCVLIRHGMEQNTVLLNFHHAIGDGLSGAYLMRDLFVAADTVIAGKNPSSYPVKGRAVKNPLYAASRG